MTKFLKYQKKWFISIGTVLLSVACGLVGETGTAIPPQRPENFEVQTATPTTDPKLVSNQSSATEAAIIVPLADAPTHTPDPFQAAATSTPTLAPTPTAITLEATPVFTPTVDLTKEAVVAAPPISNVTPDPPLQGGDWDFESDFIPWPNPYGEPCPGAAVASGWTAFVEEGPYGSSCMNENLYQPNVFSGAKSQEITFDFISANSGVFRTVPVKPGHRYSIKAYAKHDHSLSPVQMALGVDLTGETVWHGETVQWFPWDDEAEDAWIETEEVVIATGDSLTIFIKGQHPLAEQGGKTVIDNVSVTDLGP